MKRIAAQSEFLGLSHNNPHVTDPRGRLRNLGDNTHGLKFIDLTLELIFNWNLYTSGSFLALLWHLDPCQCDR